MTQVAQPQAPSPAPAHPAVGRHVWRKWWLLLLALVGAGLVGGSLALRGHSPSHGHQGGTPAPSEDDSETQPVAGVHVDVVRPTRAPLERTTVQPGNSIAWMGIDVLAEVSGYIRKQPVDIGSVVKKGDLLVEIAVPDLKAEMAKHAAAVKLAEAQVEEAKASLATARADLAAAAEKITEAQARLKASRAALTFREKQRNRYQELLALKSIDARLVDEQQDRYEAAEEAVNAAEAVLRSSRAQKAAAEARVEQAKATWEAARRKVGVAQGEFEHSRALVGFATIRAEFDGVIAYRDPNVFPGQFVRSASAGGGQPLLRLVDTNKVRMVVWIPDRDVQYCNVGDEAEVRFDNISDRVFKAKVSRVSNVEDKETKTMRCEIDIPNAGDVIKPGSYGNVTIVLFRLPSAITIPTPALRGVSQGRPYVYVVRGGKAQKVEVRTGLNNGLRVEIRKGLTTDDDVVVNSSGPLEDGMEVDANPTPRKAPGKGHR